ncbi:hypothetical protein Q1695_003024 [Nippostrongylus brasiliensis]|nr:hypothetical protein Q1695_003024 [Nippostrongylus brasiliensis]
MEDEEFWSAFDEMVSNDSFSETPKPLFAAQLLPLIPHLESFNDTSVQPIFLTKRKAAMRNLVFSIPVVNRAVHYIPHTLKSLFDKLENTYRHSIFRAQVLFIVVLAFTESELKSAKALSSSLKSQFSKEIKEGLLEIAAIPPRWYDLIPSDINPTFNDTSKRMLWRVKQNMDYLYIMAYGSTRAQYYMHLEDDVQATHNYARIIFDYIELMKNRPWFIMHCSELGFIGKLLRSDDVKYIIYAIALYYKYKPVDWILLDVESNRYCTPEKDSLHCKKAREENSVKISPPLFQHIGKVSSLSGKKQLLKESHFEKHNDKFSRNNPPAVVVSSMPAHGKHTPQAGYNKFGFMWLKDVKAGSTITIQFHNPEPVIGILFISGLAPAPLDMFGPETKVYAQFSELGEQYLGSFSEHGDFVRRLRGRNVTAIEVRVEESLERWVIVGHVVVNVMKQKQKEIETEPDG